MHSNEDPMQPKNKFRKKKKTIVHGFSNEWSFVAPDSKIPSVLGEDTSNNFLKAFAVIFLVAHGQSTNIIVCLVKDGPFSILDALTL